MSDSERLERLEWWIASLLVSQVREKEVTLWGGEMTTTITHCLVCDAEEDVNQRGKFAHEVTCAVPDALALLRKKEGR